MIHVSFDGLTIDEVKTQMIDFLGTEPQEALKTETLKAEAPKQEAPKADAPKYELATVRQACLEYRDKHGQTALTEIFTKLGVKKLTDLPAEKYGELMEMLK